MYRVIQLNPEIKKHSDFIERSMDMYHLTIGRLTGGKATLSQFANAHEYFGFHHDFGGWYYREWAPGARALYLEGDFNNWNKTSHPLTKKNDGIWEIYLPGDGALWQGCKVKTVVDNGKYLTEHVPLYIKRAVQDGKTNLFCGEVIDGTRTFPWTDDGFKGDDELYIYEAHVGMSSQDEKIASYREFADNVLPYVKKSGYNAIQLMAVMEHPYYGSFGYQVSNFYAASSRFGMPDDLKYLVNKAHKLGIRVLLDLVHSHAAKNELDGINMFDGTEWQFFHSGEKGDHKLWGTKCFDYGKPEVLHFLLSNLKFWLNEYHFDGFRFDGVTSMLYFDHGLGVDFGNADKYFSDNTDIDAINYLRLANMLIHEVKPSAVTIAEDMSAMPGMCLAVSNGGLGFDYRLAMGLPDMWIKAVKDTPDEDWNIYKMWCDMCLRRPSERTVAYAESHDQALVGDKTLIFRMADSEMYTGMSKFGQKSSVIDRAIALHKLIRLFTLSGGGDAYLAFMGNEFGHPEWIDFPREGNNNSFKYCKRQWSLREDTTLHYSELGDFDRDMLRICKRHKIFSQTQPDLRFNMENEKVIVIERKGLIFAFNFNPTESFTNLLVKVKNKCEYEIALSSDDMKYGGFDRILHITYPTKKFKKENFVELYLPARTAVILKKKVKKRIND